MIIIKNSEQIAKMKKSGMLTADVLKLLGDEIKVGISTFELNKRAVDYIKKHDATPSFFRYNGYPAAICTSVNEEVVHGIPSKDRILADGDIIGVDVGVFYNGFHGDAARTFCVGSVLTETKNLVAAAKDAFFTGLDGIKSGAHLGDIGHKVQTFVESQGYGVVRDLVGHGIGRDMHEDPEVPNYGKAGRGVRLETGMTIAVEPMINLGTYKVKTLSDGWTVVTLDGKPSAHYENTVVILSDGYEILTQNGGTL